MSNVNLNMPVLSGGILNTNFFNGRILAAEDLTTVQVANAQQHRQLGRALGSGVAWGLEVTLAGNDLAQPVLNIKQGLALNRKGEAVALPQGVNLALVKAADVVSASAGLFAECTPPQSVIPTNLDCYVLTVSPASGFQGSIPATYPSDSGFASVCASQNTVEGVKFNLLPLGVSNPSASDPTTLAGQAAQLYSQLKPLFVNLAGLTGTAASSLQSQIAPLLSKFRNVVAHLCFGTDTLSTFSANPFPPMNTDSPFDEYGALDLLRDQGILTDCAVPLALVYWTSAGIQFVDDWAVRRPLIPAAASELWPIFSGRRRSAEGIAMFLQFQAQLAELPESLGSASPNSVTAASYFRYLPPVAALPVSGILSSQGFDYPTFLAGRPYRKPQYVEGSKLLPLARESLCYPPLDLNEKVMVWVYRVRENMQAINSDSAVVPNAYVVLASGHLPNYGIPRYDVNRWDYSTYA